MNKTRFNKFSIWGEKVNYPTLIKILNLLTLVLGGISEFGQKFEWKFARNVWVAVELGTFCIIIAHGKTLTRNEEWKCWKRCECSGDVENVGKNSQVSSASQKLCADVTSLAEIFADPHAQHVQANFQLRKLCADDVLKQYYSRVFYFSFFC